MVRIRVAAAAATAAAALMALSACSELSGGSARPDGAPAGINQVDDAPPAGVTLAVADLARLGPVVTDQNGRTLYRFDEDKAKPSVSNCAGDCARTWPPVIVTDPSDVQLDDIEQGLVSTVKRADGSKQLTLNGWPLYRFAKDSRAGDAKGQGVDGTWFAATPEGRKAVIKAAPAPKQPNQPNQPEQPNQDESGTGYGY